MALDLSELNDGLNQLQKTFHDISEMHEIIVESSNFLISQLTELLKDEDKVDDFLLDD